MKQIIHTALLLLAILLPTTAFAHDFEVDGIYYNIINGNEVEVTYNGSYGCDIDEYSGTVSIPATVTYNKMTYSVTHIGNAAFECCSSLTNVIIPNSVIEIGKRAFDGCSSLIELSIGNSVNYVCEEAFCGCDSLKRVNISDLAAWCRIEFFDFYENPCFYAHHLFLNGEEITNLNIPISVARINRSAFFNCSSITHVNIPISVISIDNGAFANCRGLTDVYCHNPDPANIIMDSEVFIHWYYPDGIVFSNRTLHVPVGAIEAYQADVNWSPYFGQIVEMDLKGDANLDGVFSIADVADTIDYLLGNEVAPFNVAGADLNGNGRVDMGDLTDLIDLLLTNN